MLKNLNKKIISLIMLSIFSFISIVASKQIICSIEHGNISVNNGLVKCLSRSNKQIEEEISVSDFQLFVVGNTANNEIEITETTMELILLGSTIQSIKPILIQSNSDVIINIAKQNSIYGTNFGIGCEDNSSVKILGIRQHNLIVQSTNGPAFGSLKNNCALLEIDKIEGEIGQTRNSNNVDQRGCGIGSGKLEGNDYSFVNQIQIKNSKLIAKVTNSGYSAIGGNVEEILILNSSVETNTRSSSESAGIGPDNSKIIKHIYIKDSTILANGKNAAGIGAQNGDFSVLDIINCNVTASITTSGTAASYSTGGIGCGSNCKYDEINIKNSNINSVGYTSPGIGMSTNSIRGHKNDISVEYSIVSTDGNANNARNSPGIGGDKTGVILTCSNTTIISNFWANGVSGIKCALGETKYFDKFKVFGGYVKGVRSKGTQYIDNGGAIQNDGDSDVIQNCGFGQSIIDANLIDAKSQECTENIGSSFQLVYPNDILSNEEIVLEDDENDGNDGNDENDGNEENDGNNGSDGNDDIVIKSPNLPDNNVNNPDKNDKNDKKNIVAIVLPIVVVLLIIIIVIVVLIIFKKKKNYSKDDEKLENKDEECAI